MHTSSQPFRIKAWPFVDHESTHTYSQTSFLWPFIYYERRQNKTLFKIRPLLFTLEREPNKQLKIMFLFYSFYLNMLYDVSTTFFFLPLVLYIKSHFLQQTKKVVVFGGLLFYGTFTQIERFILMIPFLFYSKETLHNQKRTYLRQIWLPLMFRQVSHQRNFIAVLPCFYRYSDGTFTILQIWPFYGNQERKNSYMEHSVLYPLFRVRTFNNQLSIHAPWPILKYAWIGEKSSIRILPFLWIRKAATFGRGYVFLVYWEWIKDQKFTFGIFPFFHWKRDLTGKDNTNIFVLFLFFYRQTDNYCIRSITWLHVSYWEKRQAGYYYCWVLPFFFYKNHHLEHQLIIPLTLTYVRREKDHYIDIIQLPFFICFWNTRYKNYFIAATVYFYHSEDNDSTHVLLPGMIIVRFRKNLRDIWILAPFARYKTENAVSQQRLIFVLPLFFVMVKSSDKSPTFRDLLIITILFLAYKTESEGKPQNLLVVSPLVGYKKSVNGDYTFWVIPIFIAYKNTSSSLFTILPLLYAHFEYYSYYTYELTVYPFLVWARLYKYLLREGAKTDLRTYHAGLFGAYIYKNTPYQINTIILFSYYRFYRSYDQSLRIFGSLFLLPPYFFRSGPESESTFHMLWPFYVVNKTTQPKNSKSLYILPPFIRLRYGTPYVKTLSVFPLFKIKKDDQLGNFDLRVLFFFKLCLFRFRVKRSRETLSYFHIKKTRIHLFPIVFWKRKVLLQRCNTSSSNTNINYYSLAETNLPLQHDYSYSNPVTSLTLLGPTFGYGLFSIKINRQRYGFQMYLVPLFHIEYERGSLIDNLQIPDLNNNYNNKRRIASGDFVSIACFWILHPRLSLISYSTRSKSTTILEHYSCFYAMFLFYMEARNKVQYDHADVDDTGYSYNNKRTIAFFWAFHAKVSLFYRYSEYSRSTNKYYDRTYLFPIFWYEVNKTVNAQTTSFALFWALYKYVTLFYLERKTRQAPISNRTKLELQDTSNSDQITVAVPESKLQKSYWAYSPILFYTEQTFDNLFRLSIIWLFVRQATLLRYTKQPGIEVKFTLFPLFKYARRSGQWSKWCLIPLVPVKYSFIASVLAREKEVLNKGKQLTSGVEDKHGREENVDVRFIYRVIRYQKRNGVATLEINPFFNSEKDPSRASEWNCLGGCIGQRKIQSRDDEFRCCCFFYF